MSNRRGSAIIAINTIFPILSILAVALRLYARRLKNLALKSHDYTIIGALVITIANSMPYIYCATNGGLGQHLHDISLQEVIVFGKVTFATQFPYIFAVSLVKISILQFYKSIFTTRRFSLLVNIVGGLVLAWTITFFFASLFQALPIASNWNLEKPASFINELAMYIAQAVLELVLDVATLILPWTIIWKLHLKTSRKVMVTGIFMLGAFACVASAARIYYLATTNTGASQDFTYDTYNIFIWTAIEPCTGVICACLPALGPIFQGGRTPETLIGSIRSYIQLRTQGRRNKSSIWSSRIREESNIFNASSTKSLHNMPEDVIVLTSVQGRKLDDVESQGMPADGILVQTKMSTSDDEGRRYFK